MNGKDTMDLKSTEKNARRFYHVVPRPLRRVVKRNWLEWKLRDAKDNAMPDFYIIGAMKCGTTSLYMYLEPHPDVAPASEKEIHYFNTDRDLGLNYFKSHFPPRSSLEARDTPLGRQLVGEATPDYIFHPAAPRLCRELTPDAKLILLMRNPVDRAFSHWKQGHRFGFETESFETAIELEEARIGNAEAELLADPHHYSYAHHLYSYLARGYYAKQIKNWLQYFPKEQFMFIRAEDMFEDGLGVYQNVTRFLGISDWVPEDFSLKFKGVEGDINPETREKLVEHFRPHNEELYELLGRDLGWS